jgi:DNA-binding XRE family transcriptional regulator
MPLEVFELEYTFAVNFNMSKNVDFGKRLVEVRKARGLTQDEVAERCNINVRTIQRIESGEVTPRAFTIKTISEVLKFDFFEASTTGNEADKKSRYARLKFYLTDLFNLKTHAMRKITILAMLCLLVVLAVFAFMPKAEAKNQKLPNFINTPERVEVAFTNDFTIDSLVYIKNELMKRGITISYKRADFDKAGRLLTVSASVDCGDGFSGSFSNEADPFSVFFRYEEGLKQVSNAKEKRVGFFRYYNKKAKILFLAGCINCGEGADVNKGYLYVVDGKEVDSISHISPDSIESISVLKEQTSVEQYGEKGRNGVVIIATKK